MCRFLLAESEKPFEPQELVHAFAGMSEKSKAYDGDWQGDGSGIAWFQNGNWEVATSIEPFWESLERFSAVPETTHVVMHARSASFEKHKGVLEYNQPYISGKYAFVFNGLLKGVSFPYPLEGTIGAQKIWSLLQRYLEEHSPIDAIQKSVEMLNKHTKRIQALNIGLSDGEQVYSYTQFDDHEDYYNLQVSRSEDMNMVCSEGLEGFSFEKAKPEQVFLL